MDKTCVKCGKVYTAENDCSILCDSCFWKPRNTTSQNEMWAVIADDKMPWYLYDDIEQARRNSTERRVFGYCRETKIVRVRVEQF